MNQRILVTSALPYANGDIHIGHLVEYLQTDFWVRFQKMRGHNCRYICADDTHGTPITIRARKEGISPEELIAQSHASHLADFTDFQIEFDHYGSTNSDLNRQLCEAFYVSMQEAGHIFEKGIQQAYCEHDKMFLPDRFLQGTCPKCHAPNQYGDSCDVCGATYATDEIIDPACSICGNTPVTKESKHVFFRLNDFREFLKSWVREHTPAEVANKMDEWLQEELRDWDISREAPYFGFEIPGYQDTFFYVWVDAPMGYVSSTKAWCEEHGEDFDAWWKNEDTRVVHFIGKDIVYFHTLFWPAMLKCAGFKTPDQVYVHGFLTVNGEKMSKSRGTFIKARTYLEKLDPLYLRFYYGCKLNSGLGDVDLSFDDFVQRVNSELIGKITNLASRGAQMLGKKLDGRMGSMDEEGLALVKKAQQAGEEIAQHYENRDFNRAVQSIRSLAEEGNRYFDEKQPWITVKTDPEATRVSLTVVLNLFRVCAVYLKPVLPHYVAKVEALFGEQPYDWSAAQKLLENKEIGVFEHLAARLDPAQLEAMVEASKEEAAPAEEPAVEYEALEPEITVDDLFKCDLRVARIVEAEDVPKAGKLLKLVVDLGFEKREILAGIKKAYRPEDLVGKLTVVVANLKPRKMKFGTSQGMVLAAGPGEREIFLLNPDDGAVPGQRIQ